MEEIVSAASTLSVPVSEGRVKPGPGSDPQDPSHGTGTNVVWMPVDALPAPSGDGEHRVVSSHYNDGVRDEVWVYSAADNVWIPEKDWNARQGIGNTGGGSVVDVPVEFHNGDTRVDYNGKKLIYMNGRWIDYYAFMEGIQPSNHPKPTPDPWIPRNPEEIDLNPSSGMSSVDVNPVGGMFGYNYLGPYTTVARNIAAGVEPVDELDAIARDHDLAYQRIADKYARGNISYTVATHMVRAADRKFIAAASKLWTYTSALSAVGMTFKTFVDQVLGWNMFVGLRRKASPVRGYQSLGAGSPVHRWRVPFVERNARNDGYVYGFRRSMLYDDDIDRDRVPDMINMKRYLRRRRMN